MAKINTYADAIKAGYTNAHTAWQRGYVSRKIDPNTQPVLTARDGSKYVLLPSWQSTQYCTKQYLNPPKDQQ